MQAIFGEGIVLVQLYPAEFATNPPVWFFVSLMLYLGFFQMLKKPLHCEQNLPDHTEFTQNLYAQVEHQKARFSLPSPSRPSRRLVVIFNGFNIARYSAITDQSSADILSSTIVGFVQLFFGIAFVSF
jgi:hypothetical protein